MRLIAYIRGVGAYNYDVISTIFGPEFLFEIN
jgi:hypothetical protein